MFPIQNNNNVTIGYMTKFYLFDTRGPEVPLVTSSDGHALTAQTLSSDISPFP